MRILISLFLLLWLAQPIIAQTVKIYHGRSGTTTIVNEDSEKTLKIAPGKKVKIKIVNPNLYYYKYTFTIDSTKVKEEMPSFDQLTTLLNSNISIPAITDIEETTGTTSTGRPFPSASYPNKVSFDKYKELFAYVNRLDSLTTILKELIVTSDIPNYLEEKESNFAKVKDKVERLKLSMNDQLFLKYGNIAKSEDSASVPNGTNNKVLVNTLKKYASLLIDNYNTICNEFSSHGDNVEFETTVKKDQKLTINLNITKKIDSGIRDVEEKIITIEVMPIYKRTSFEIVPVGSLIYGGKVSEFGINNGFITENEVDGFRISPGLVFQYNFVSFGENNKNAIGLGMGIAASSEGNSLDNLFANVMFSHMENFRLSLGAGYSQFPTRLSNSNQVGQPVSGNFSSIDELLVYSRKPSIFFSFSLFGLDIPLIK